MMLGWNEYQKQITANNAQIGRINHEILRGYRGLSEAGSGTNLLGGKVRELIASAVAVTRQCDGCIITHTDAAIKQGATKEGVVETLSVAVAVNAGAALIFSSGVIDAFNTKTRANTVPGSELDDADEIIGEEDEENNYYSIGGDDHNDLDEDE